MRKRTFLLAFLPLILLLNSCRKDAGVETGTEPAKKESINKLNTWLNDQLAKATPNNKVFIQLVKDNLVYSTTHTEILNETEQFIVISLKESFKSSYQKDKKPVSTLVLIQTAEGTIRDGKVIQYFPGNNESITSLPGNSIHQLYNNREEFKLEGKFRALTVTDNILYEASFKNGRLRSSGIMKSKPTTETSGAGNRVNQCIAWYLITTYYYDDGTTETVEEYIGTTGDCDFEGHEPPGNGEGSGGGPEVVIDRAVSKQTYWLVNVAQNLTWHVKSYETLKGMKVPSEPGGGHYTSITHNSSSVFNNPPVNYPQNGPPFSTYVQLAYLATINDPSWAMSTVSGKVTLYYGEDIATYNSHPFFFPLEFP